MLDLTVTEGLEILASAKTSREKIQAECTTFRGEEERLEVGMGVGEVGGRSAVF
jgi:hypothetical protein